MKTAFVSLTLCLAACAYEPDEVGTTQQAGTASPHKLLPQTVSASDDAVPKLYDEYAYAGVPNSFGSGRLVVYLHGQGGTPESGVHFMGWANLLGYNVVGVSYYNNSDYPDGDDEAIPGLNDICGGNEACVPRLYQQMFDCSPQTDNLLFDPGGACIKRRLEKLLAYLAMHYPNEGWGNFLSGSNLLWGRIVLVGHSRGSAMAAWIAQQKQVLRTIMLSGPAGDPIGTFPGPLLRGPESGYALMHIADDTVSFPKSANIWNVFGMPGPHYCVDDLCANPVCSLPIPSQYCGSHQLVSARVTDTPHNDTVKNEIYAPAWVYMLSHDL